MGMILGKIKVETPKYELIKATTAYEIRKYPPCVIAQVTYNSSEMKNNNKDGGFTLLANYIGALGNPKNSKSERITMTAPVITSSISEKITMTAPVVTTGGERDEEETVMMKFIVSSKYEKEEEAPKPLDERIEVMEEGERVYGVMKFSLVASDEVVEEKVEVLRKKLEEDRYRVVGGHLLARYNPPFTLPMLGSMKLCY